MNANELADINEWSCCAHSKEVSAMLRQQQAKLEKSQELLREYTALNMRQQAEIEALKNRNWDLVSEPWGFDRHPAKTLTDEEIRHIQAICHLKDVGYNNFIMRFARAILRKAQEKTTESVMSEHCTCYKLGYSQLNDYAKVKAK